MHKYRRAAEAGSSCCLRDCPQQAEILQQAVLQQLRLVHGLLAAVSTRLQQHQQRQQLRLKGLRPQTQREHLYRQQPQQQRQRHHQQPNGWQQQQQDERCIVSPVAASWVAHGYRSSSSSAVRMRRYPTSRSFVFLPAAAGAPVTPDAVATCGPAAFATVGAARAAEPAVPTAAPAPSPSRAFSAEPALSANERNSRAAAVRPVTEPGFPPAAAARAASAAGRGPAAAASTERAAAVAAGADTGYPCAARPAPGAAAAAAAAAFAAFHGRYVTAAKNRISMPLRFCRPTAFTYLSTSTRREGDSRGRTCVSLSSSSFAYSCLTCSSSFCWCASSCDTPASSNTVVCRRSSNSTPNCGSPTCTRYSSPTSCCYGRRCSCRSSTVSLDRVCNHVSSSNSDKKHRCSSTRVCNIIRKLQGSRPHCSRWACFLSNKAYHRFSRFGGSRGHSYSSSSHFACGSRQCRSRISSGDGSSKPQPLKQARSNSSGAGLSRSNCISSDEGSRSAVGVGRSTMHSSSSNNRMAVCSWWRDGGSSSGWSGCRSRTSMKKKKKKERSSIPNSRRSCSGACSVDGCCNTSCITIGSSRSSCSTRSNTGVGSSWGHSDRSRGGVLAPLAVVGLFGISASACVSGGRGQSSVFEIPVLSPAENAGLRQPYVARNFARTLGHAFLLKQQQELPLDEPQDEEQQRDEPQEEEQQQEQRKLEEALLQGRRSAIRRDGLFAAAAERAVGPSGAASLEQQLPLSDEDGAPAIQAAAPKQKQPESAASEPLQASVQDGGSATATAAAGQDRSAVPELLAGDHQQKLDLKAHRECMPQQLLRQPCTPTEDELLLRHHVNTEALQSSQEAPQQQDVRREEQRETGRQQKEQQQQRYWPRQSCLSLEHHGLPLVGRQLLRFIGRLPWARRLNASLNSAAAAKAAPYVEATAGEPEVAAAESGEAAAAPAKGVGAEEDAMPTRAARKAAGEISVGGGENPAVLAGEACCRRTAATSAGVTAGTQALPTMAANAATAAVAAAEAESAAAESAADPSVTAGTTEAQVPAGAAGSTAAWWASHAPRYLGPVIKRISRRPADVQLRLIQLALTHTPLQEHVCAPQRQQLQQQAQMLRLQCGGSVLLQKPQQVVRSTAHGAGNTGGSRGGRVWDAHAASTEETAERSQSKATAADRAEPETGTVPAGVDGISEEDVIIFGAPFLWFTLDPRLPILQRFWCVEQLTFWLHASGRPSALRHLHQQQQELQPPLLHQQLQHESQGLTTGEAAQQQHHYPRVQLEQELQETQLDCIPVQGQGSLASTPAQPGKAQLSAAASWNEGCFQLSPQGDLQISDIRVWRSIGISIKYLLREGFIDNAAHMLYSMLSLVYDARAFPAPAAAPSATTNANGHRAEAGNSVRPDIAGGAALQFTCAATASPRAAQGDAALAAALAAEMKGGIVMGGCLAVPATTSASVGASPSTTTTAAVSEGAELSHADDAAAASGGAAAAVGAAVGASASELPSASIAASVRKRALLVKTATPAVVPTSAVSESAAPVRQGAEPLKGGYTLSAPVTRLAADQEKLPFLTKSSTRGLREKNTTAEGGGNSSSVSTQATHITQEDGDVGYLDGSSNRSFGGRTHSAREPGTTRDTFKRSSTTRSLSLKATCSNSASVQFSSGATSSCGSTRVSQAPAERDTERLARHLGLTRWSISKPVWLKLLARRQRLSSAERDNDEVAEQQRTGAAVPPLRQHELEALALLESLFFMFHDEVGCAAKVMAEAFEKQQAIAERTAGMVAKEEAASAAAADCYPVSTRSSPLCNAASKATSKRLVEKFTAAGQASAGGQGHMQQYLRRLRIVKVAVQRAAGQNSEQQQSAADGPSSSGDGPGQRRTAGARQWVAVLLPSSEAGAQTKETFAPQTCRETATSSSLSYRLEPGPKFSRFEGQNEGHRLLPPGPPCWGDTAEGSAAAPPGATRAREVTGATQPSAAAEPRTFGLRTLVWYLRLQSHFYKVQSVPFTTFVCRLLTRLLRMCELQRLYPAGSKTAEISSGASSCGSTNVAAFAAAKPLSLFAKRETLPLPFSRTPADAVARGTLGPLQDGVIVSRLAPSARGATMATPAAVLLAQILEAVKAVHFYDHDLLHACCEALRPNVCLLPPQYACGVIFNLGCLGYSDPALASAVAHFLVDSGLLKTATKVDAMMQLLIGFSRLDFRDDRLTFACIDALMAMPDVLSSTCRPVSLFYLLHSISFHNVRCLPLLAKLLPALQRFATIVPTNVAVLTFHDLVRNSVWPGPYRRLLVPRLLNELSSLAVATLAGATPLCWSLWGHFDVPLLLKLVQQFNATRIAGSSRVVNNAGRLPQTQTSADREIHQQSSVTANRRKCSVLVDGASEREAHSRRILCNHDEQELGDEGGPRCGDGPTTLTLVKASTQFWSAFYCVQLLGLTPRDFLPQVLAMDKQYRRTGSKTCKRQRRAKDAASDRNPPVAMPALRWQRPVGHSSSVPSSSPTVYDKAVAGKQPYKVTSPASIYFITPHFNSSPSVRFSPWQAGSLAGLRAAQILQTPEANWTPKSSTLHEEVLAACPHKVRAAAINEQPAGPYEVDLVVPPGVVASTHADCTERKKRSGRDAPLHYNGKREAACASLKCVTVKDGEMLTYDIQKGTKKGEQRLQVENSAE